MTQAPIHIGPQSTISMAGKAQGSTPLIDTGHNQEKIESMLLDQRFRLDKIRRDREEVLRKVRELAAQDVRLKEAEAKAVREFNELRGLKRRLEDSEEV